MVVLMAMPKCAFGSDDSVKFTYPISGQTGTYHCPLDAHENGLCLFHNPNTSDVPDDNQIADLIFKSTLGIGLFIGFHLKKFDLSALQIHIANLQTSVLFQDVKFYDDINFQDVNSNALTFVECTFSATAQFKNCNVQIIEFERVYFHKGAKFIECKFTNANYFKTTFYETVEFTSNTEIGNLFFSEVYFLKRWTTNPLTNPDQFVTRLSHAKFGKLRALESEYHNKLECDISTFGSIDFDECHFFGPLSFRYSTFIENIKFKESDFDEKIDFFKAKFETCKQIDFTDSTFKGEIRMSGLKIKKFYIHSDPVARDLSFYTIKTVFDKKIDFSKTSFEEFYLYNTIFEEHADFTEATFENIFRTNSNTSFRNGANFTRSIFGNETEFNGVFFPSGNDLIKVNFDSADFKKGIKFTGQNIRKLDLSTTSFKGTNLKNCEFNNVNWLERDEKFLKRKIVIDELLLDKNNNYEDVSKIYYGLRKNYESRLLFNEASPFFIGEMECKRKALEKDKKSLERMGYKIYKWLAFYGESVKMPLAVWTPIIVLLFTFGRFIPEYTPSQDLLKSIPNESLDNIKCGILNIKWECFHYSFIDSLSAFFQFPRANHTLDIIERIISAPILGTAFIALKRKFERNK